MIGRIPLLAALLLSGCANRFYIEGSVVYPTPNSEWLEVNTPHFKMVTDLSRPDAIEVATQLEQAYRTLVDLTDFLFPGRPTPRLQTTVLQLRTRGELDDLTGMDRYVGHFISRGAWGQPTLLAYGDLTDETRQVLLHELTHRLVAHHVPRAGPWLHEGLARYFESLQISSGVARLGEIPRTVRNGLRPYELPSVLQLLAANHERFHDDSEKEKSLEHREAGYYTGAWGLVHLLNNGTEGYRPRLLNLLEMLASNVPANAAWQTAVAGLSMVELERHYRHHFVANERFVYQTPYTIPQVPAPDAETLPAPTVQSILTSVYRNVERVRGPTR